MAKVKRRENKPANINTTKSKPEKKSVRKRDKKASKKKAIAATAKKIEQYAKEQSVKPINKAKKIDICDF